MPEVSGGRVQARIEAMSDQELDAALAAFIRQEQSVRAALFAPGRFTLLAPLQRIRPVVLLDWEPDSGARRGKPSACSDDGHAALLNIVDDQSRFCPGQIIGLCLIQFIPGQAGEWYR